MDSDRGFAVLCGASLADPVFTARTPVSGDEIERSAHDAATRVSRGWMFSPVSTQAHAITQLMVILFAICAGIFVLVAWLVTHVAIRFRRRAGAGEPRQVFGSTRVETLWTAGPLLLLVVIFALTVVAARAADP
jgi:heme/copper-type cytochrome/quinol oxidase subunit 2